MVRQKNEQKFNQKLVNAVEKYTNISPYFPLTDLAQKQSEPFSYMYLHMYQTLSK